MELVFAFNIIISDFLLAFLQVQSSVLEIREQMLCHLHQLTEYIQRRNYWQLTCSNTPYGEKKDNFSLQ